MKAIVCPYTDPPHLHQFPDDWIFGGNKNLDPRADERYQCSTYTYYNSDATALWVTQTPLCDDQAIDEFTKIASMGRTFDPKWIGVKRPDGTVEMLPWVYDKTTDEVTEVIRNGS